MKNFSNEIKTAELTASQSLALYGACGFGALSLILQVVNFFS